MGSFCCRRGLLVSTSERSPHFSAVADDIWKPKSTSQRLHTLLRPYNPSNKREEDQSSEGSVDLINVVCYKQAHQLETRVQTQVPTECLGTQKKKKKPPKRRFTVL